jgi:hypothetical protein
MARGTAGGVGFARTDPVLCLERANLFVRHWLRRGRNPQPATRAHSSRERAHAEPAAAVPSAVRGRPGAALHTLDAAHDHGRPRLLVRHADAQSVLAVHRSMRERTWCRLRHVPVSESSPNLQRVGTEQVRREPSVITNLDGRDDMPLFFASARSASKNSAPGTEDEAGTAAAGAGAGAVLASALSGTASPEAAASAAAGRAGGWNDASGTTSAANGRAAR